MPGGNCRYRRLQRTADAALVADVRRSFVLSVQNAARRQVERPGAPGLEMPSSGLNDQRWLPRLTILLLSYCPVGAITAGLHRHQIR
jgi:hypothetical protein